METLTLGIVADEAIQRLGLQDFAESFSYQVLLSCSPQQWLEKSHETEVDAWLIDIDLDEKDHPELMHYLDQCDQPIIFGMEKLPQNPEVRKPAFRRLQAKLMSAMDEQFSVSNRQRPTPEVWILAASLGGPEAVKKFIDVLPSDVDVIFLYAQHLDEKGSQALIDVLGRNSKIPVQAMNDITLLHPGHIYTVPIDSVIEFSKHYAYKIAKPWSGGYRPSINELLTSAHKQFDDRLNVIFFSGMGEDGADKARKIQARSAQIWAQSPESSVSAVMPLSVIEQNICQRVESPEGLAKALLARVQN